MTSNELPLQDNATTLTIMSDSDIITVVIPEFVTSVGTQWLHNQSALQLKLALLYRPHTVVTSVPIHIDVETRKTPAGGSQSSNV